jgi:hypothetical protein
MSREKMSLQAKKRIPVRQIGLSIFVICAIGTLINFKNENALGWVLDFGLLFGLGLFVFGIIAECHSRRKTSTIKANEVC